MAFPSLCSENYRAALSSDKIMPRSLQSRAQTFDKYEELGQPYLNGPPDNHDGIMQGPLRLLHELLGTSTQEYGASLGLGAASEEVVPGKGGARVRAARGRPPRQLLMDENETDHSWYSNLQQISSPRGQSQARPQMGGKFS